MDEFWIEFTNHEEPEDLLSYDNWLLDISLAPKDDKVISFNKAPFPEFCTTPKNESFSDTNTEGDYQISPEQQLSLDPKSESMIQIKISDTLIENEHYSKESSQHLAKEIAETLLIHQCIYDPKILQCLDTEICQALHHIFNLAFVPRVLPKTRNTKTSSSVPEDLHPLDKIQQWKHGPITFSNQDFYRPSKRRDETLKKILSQALKKIYRDFIKKHGINKSLNPKKYTKRKEINRLIFIEYFKRDPLTVGRDGKTMESDLIFVIKNGVTKVWFEYAMGGSDTPNNAFLAEIYRIIENGDLFSFYQKKISSMLNRIFLIEHIAPSSAPSEVDNDASETSDTEAIESVVQDSEGAESNMNFTSSILERVTVKFTSKKSRKPKIPSSKAHFLECIQISLKQLMNLALEKGLKLK